MGIIFFISFRSHRPDQTFEEANKNNCFKSFFVCWLRKSWVYRLIQKFHVHIRALKLHVHFNVGKKTKLVKLKHITKFWKLKNFSSTEMQYFGTILVIHTAIFLSYCNIKLWYITDCNILHCYILQCNIKLQYTVIFL